MDDLRSLIENKVEQPGECVAYSAETRNEPEPLNPKPKALNPKPLKPQP